MWRRDGTYLYRDDGRVRISKWALAVGPRYNVQRLENGQWVDKAKPAPDNAEEAKRIAEGL